MENVQVHNPDEEVEDERREQPHYDEIGVEMDPEEIILPRPSNPIEAVISKPESPIPFSKGNRCNSYVI